MGNELSSASYEGPPEVLEGRDISAVAKYMKSDACKNVFVMNGAGVSTSAGIPDFRSPGTGLYHNLERLNLPYPEAVFEINFFRENPAPFYTLARELMPGKYRPTPTHSFVKLLHNRGLLRMCYTQNIDTLERLAGLPDESIVEAHGSFANQHCIECGSWYDQHKLRDQILRGEVAQCYECGGLVKPDIVFFGESLPPRFHKTIGLLRSADLLIIMGTSLKVHPFATLTQLVPESCPRVLINLDPAGDIGTRPDDVILLGKTDDVVRDICKELGEDWEDELKSLWKETEKYAHVEGTEAELKERLILEEGKVPAVELETKKEELEVLGEERLREQVEEIAREIETALHIGTVPPPEGEPGIASELEGKGGADVEEKVATEKPEEAGGTLPGQGTAREAEAEAEKQKAATEQEAKDAEVEKRVGREVGDSTGKGQVQDVEEAAKREDTKLQTTKEEQGQETVPAEKKKEEQGKEALPTKERKQEQQEETIPAEEKEDSKPDAVHGEVEPVEAKPNEAKQAGSVDRAEEDVDSSTAITDKSVEGKL